MVVHTACGLFACIDQASVGIVEKFGKFDRLAQPGFNCVCCCIGDTLVSKLSLRVQQLDVTCETKTKDNVFVTMVVSVQYQVVKENVYDAYYKLTDSRSQIRSYVFDNVRASVPNMMLDEVFVEKEAIAQGIKTELSKSMSVFGFSIVNALVTDIVPDARVKQAMNEINASQRLRVAAVEKAEAEKIKVVKAAEADAEAKFLAGQGVARQRQAIVNGLKESVVNFSSDVSDITSRDVLDLMLMTQYFDAVRDVGVSGGTSKIFIPHSPAAVSDVAAQVRNGFMQAH